MSVNALIVKRGVSRTRAVVKIEEKDATRIGIKVLAKLKNGTLVTGDKDQIKALEKAGYRVVIYQNPNLLKIGDWIIDINGLPDIPRSLKVPSGLKAMWPHHLVQLVGPPTQEWIKAIEAEEVQVVRRISQYALFVTGLPEKVEKINDLSFVAWSGAIQPAYRIDKKILEMKGRIDRVNIGVYPPEEAEHVKEELENSGGRIHRVDKANPVYHAQSTWFLTSLPRRSIPKIARLPYVVRIEYSSPDQTHGERETQILVGRTVPGYQNSLSDLGVNGTNVTIAICDSGVDAGLNNNANGHLDLRGRQAAFLDYSATGWNSDNDGHGTHVAGIAIGDAATGENEGVAPNNFLWGQGTAPASQYITQQRGQPLNTPLGGYPVFTREAVVNGADVQNNSWGGALDGYDGRCETWDQLVRNPNPNTVLNERMCIVFSAGNSGGLPSTLSSPGEAKNVITVGNSLTSRPGVGNISDNIRGLNGCSSRGPGQSALGTRIKPDVVAPGTDVSSVWSETGSIADHGNPIVGTGNPDPANPGNIVNQYIYMSGTSMAAPHVSGCCALLTEWWRNRTDGRNPSPAMLKALLINGAIDLGQAPAGENWKEVPHGTFNNTAGAANTFQSNNLGFTPQQVLDNNWGNVPPQQVMNQVGSLATLNANGQWFYDVVNDILYVRRFNGAAPTPRTIWTLDTNPINTVPNFDQGWGLVNLPNMILQPQPPGSPPLTVVSDRGPKIFSDQRHAFDTNNDTVVFRVAPVDTTRAMRITLVWTDGPGIAGNPALINDLDLEVLEVTTNDLYLGNVFANGFSTLGGNADQENNVECVYIQNPNGIYEITVRASTLTGNARPPFDNTAWQDFALVMDNAEYTTGNPACIVPVIDRSGSMTTFGYVGVTRTSSKQFIDLMSPDDEIGLVSFGNVGEVEYPTDGSNIPDTVVDSNTLRDVKTEVDGIDFTKNECTYMGDGLGKARDLLNQSPGNLDKAMVLLSDGYDNKGSKPGGGCDRNNAAKPSAFDVASNLVDIPVYTCAMGPNSDQELLEDIADATDGQYYYMPTIDDLFEIYNYIRGQVTGDGIIVNDSTTASKSRLGGWVDCGASKVTFTVAWVDTSVKYVDSVPKKPKEISILLRDPNNNLLHPNCTYVRRKVGDGYVVFSIDEPIPGRWYVEVETAEGVHLRYTVGGFVDSSLHMVITPPKEVHLGRPFEVEVKVNDGRIPVTTMKATAKVKAPSYEISTLLRRYKAQLDKIQLGNRTNADMVPEQLEKLVILRNQMIAKGDPDIFVHSVETVQGQYKSTGGSQPLSIREPATVARPSTLHTERIRERVLNPEFTTLASLSTAVASIRKELEELTEILSLEHAMKVPVTARRAGSINIDVAVSGVSPRTDCRFERKGLLSMVIRQH